MKTLNQKNILKAAICVFLLGGLIASCSKGKSDPVAVDLTTVTATADNDLKSGGVYKGTLIGSTGSIKIVIQGDSKAAYLIFDGVTKTLETSDLGSWNSGQAINNASFTSGDWRIVFSVNANGSNPRLVVTIPGHNVSVAIVKEATTSLTRAYEGTFTVGNLTSTFNFVSKGDTAVTGVIRTTDALTVPLRGSIVGGRVTVSADSGTGYIIGSGTITGTTASGTFTETGYSSSYTVSGTWTAKKTL